MFGSNKFGWLKHLGYNGSDDGGGGGESTQTTVQKADPWSGVQPYLSSAYETASNLYGPDSTGPELYGGQYTVDPDPLRTQAQDYQQWWATSQLPQNIADINTAYGRLLNAPNVENNPWLQGAANAAISPIMQQYQENILPGIRSGAMQSGQYGGSRQGVAEGIAAGRTSQAIGDTTSRIYADAYNQGMESLAKGLSFSPTFLDIGMKPASSLYDLATQKENIAQTDLNEAIKRWEYEQNLPYSQLSDYLALLNGASGGSSSSTSTGTQPNYGGGDSTLGTLGSILSIASMFAGFSDRRLKKNIHRIGNYRNGLSKYSFEYIWGNEKHIGPMADEVEKIMPEAIGSMLGYKTVNYMMLGI